MPNPKIERLLYTIPETQYLLTCSRIALWRWVKAGKLRPVRLGRCVRFTPEEILRFVADRSAQ